MGIVETILLFILVYVLSIIFHEIGHALYYMSKNQNFRYSLEWIALENKLYSYVGNSLAFKGFSKKEKIDCYGYGIFWGVLPIAFAGLIYTPYLLILMFPYLWGCRSDFNKIYKLIK